jgi:hypothetical protein
MKSGGLFESRRAMLAAGVSIEYVRVSDAALFGDAKPVRPNFAARFNPAAVADTTTWAPSEWWNVLEYPGFAGSYNRRAIWLGGVPERVTKTDGNGDPYYDSTFAAFQTALGTYNGILLNGSWGFIGYRSGPTQPEFPILDLKNTSPVQIFVLAGALSDFQWIRLRRPRGTNWPHGQFQVVQVRDDAGNVKSGLYELRGAVLPQGGFVESRKPLLAKILVEAFFSFDGLGNPELRHKKRGRPFGLPRGRNKCRAT